jgi:DHA2 family multidrug resistance protein-like MFS transporter
MALGAKILMSVAPEAKAGSAASIMETSGELGVALGIASIGSAAAAPDRVGPDTGLAGAGVATAAAADASRGIDEALAAAIDLPGELGTTLAAAAREAFLSSVYLVGVLAALTFVALAVTSVLALTSTASNRTTNQ